MSFNPKWWPVLTKGIVSDWKWLKYLPQITGDMRITGIYNIVFDFIRASLGPTK